MRRVTIHVSEKVGDVSGIADIPDGVTRLLVFAHGAGAGMEHSFMSEMSQLLHENGIGTLRFNFPYMEAGKRSPDRQPVLLETWAAVARFAAESFKNLQLYAGGKSMGGRMASLAMVKGGLEQVNGLVYFGFPLHAPGRDSTDRARHLEELDVPMLFLQGTRDRLANTDLIKEVFEVLGPGSRLEFFEGADHSFKTRKKDARTRDEVMQDAARITGEWMDGLT